MSAANVLETSIVLFGDCFAYALARVYDESLLCVGDDFIHMDIEPALSPA